MVDSTAANQHGSDLPRVSVLNEDQASAEHASALLRMGALRQEAGDYPEAEDLFERALEIGERTLDPESLAFVTVLMSLAATRIMRGKLEDVEPLVLRALALSENRPAERDPGFVVLLNDLTRLALKQSAHGVAEPLCLRLLDIKRSKGEDHPEVATVLASLATVRQAQGRHESAEQLWRRVLEIRERTLAPNHFALVMALEHLAEACAARGKLGEALQLFKRAQSIRELTLGAGHSSLTVSRDRIADLQLQASEDSLDSSAFEASSPVPEKYRLLASENSGVNSPRPAKPRSAIRQWKGTAPAIERDTSRKETASPVSPPPSVVEVTPADSQPRPSHAPYIDVLLSINQELEEDQKADTLSHRITEIFTAAAAMLRERRRAIAIGIAAVALVAALVVVPQVWSGAPQVAIAEGLSDPGTSTVPSASAPEASNGSNVVAGDPAPPAVASASTSVIPSSRARSGDRRGVARNRTGETGDIAIPKVLSPSMPGLDSVVRSRSTAPSGADETFAVAPPPVSGSSQPLTFERDAPVNEPQPARLIGTLPTPRAPRQLEGVEGDVRLRFEVDPSGRPVMSSVSVLASPNVLLTAAVLKVIPGLRFEPARSGGAEPKPVADVVQLRFQFRPTK